MSVYAHGRRVHEPLEAPSGRRLQEPLGTSDVDVAIVGIGVAGGPVDGGHVNERVGPLEQPFDGAPVREVPLDQPGPGRAQGLGHRGGPEQGRDVVPAGAKGFEQPTPRVPGGSGEGDMSHRPPTLSLLRFTPTQSTGIGPRAGKASDGPSLAGFS